MTVAMVKVSLAAEAERSPIAALAHKCAGAGENSLRCSLLYMLLLRSRLLRCSLLLYFLLLYSRRLQRVALSSTARWSNA